MDTRQNSGVKGIDSPVKGRVSVIVPVYNSEKYLEEAVNSVLSQKYNNYEIILINDGSTDQSAVLCDKLASSYECIRVIHQKNAGVSAARNAGIDCATGEYILFLDSDDRLPADTIATYTSISTEDHFIMGRWCDIDENGRLLSESHHLPNEIISSNQAGVLLYDERQYGYLGVIASKLYKLEIIRKNKLHFEMGVAYNEDRLFTLSYLKCCKNVLLTDAILYEYRQHKESAMGALSSTFKPQMLTELDAFALAMKKVPEKSELYYLINHLLFEKALYWYGRIPSNMPEYRKKIGEVIYRSAVAALADRKKNWLSKIKIIGHGILKK